MSSIVSIRHCTSPWRETYTHVNGAVKPCCFAASGFGNLNDVDTLLDLTEGPLAQELRGYVAAGRLHPICSGASCVFVMYQQSSEEELAGAAVWAKGLSTPALPVGINLDPALVTRALLGQKNATFNMGMEAFRASQFDLAIEWYQTSSRAGYEVADRMLGLIYFYGNGTKKDLSSAERYFRRAAEMGDGPACTSLGLLAQTRDPAEAVGHFQMGADRGDSEGWRQLALAHRVGKGVPQNLDEARRLMKLAAQRGNEAAKAELAAAEAAY